MPEEKVELLPAFRWICPECGGDHFERGVETPLNEEEIAELKAMYEVEGDLNGCFFSAPDQVTCPDCGQEYETVNYGDDEEDQSDIWTPGSDIIV